MGSFSNKKGNVFSTQFKGHDCPQSVRMVMRASHNLQPPECKFTLESLGLKNHQKTDDQLTSVSTIFVLCVLSRNVGTF